MTREDQALDQLGVNTIRTLSMDMVQKANSGHPGLPMGAAAMAYALWDRFLKHNPRDPHWPDRDRFILSAGHGCALIYSLLHLTGYDLPLDELMRFRQLHSKTPGHPEYGLAPGIETTTGPLGQGFATGVGMAMAERYLASVFNRPGHEIIDHYTYAICSDGDLMEGVSYEAASLAGHLKLGKLIYLYDDNHITIEGDTSLAFSEDVSKRFDAAGWHVQRIDDGNDLEAIDASIRAAQAATDRPSIICVRTHIAFGSPNKHDSAAAHGNPLGVDEVKLTKENLGWPTLEPFFIPDESLGHFREAIPRGEMAQAAWTEKFEAYRRVYPELAATFEQALRGEQPHGWQESLPSFSPEGGQLATRTASGKTLNAVAGRLPLLVGGSADLASSTDTTLEGFGSFRADNYGGRTFHFGIREHAMGAALNGLAVHGGLRPYGATFLTFSDYNKPAIRIAALMRAPSTFVFTHDSIGLGEDGPTHQPIEHLTALRAVPHLTVVRPADATETAAAWVAILNQRGPAALVLTRQRLPVLAQSIQQAIANVARGAYVLVEAEGARPEIVLIGTGSEVHLATEAQQRLAADGVAARVVSMPSWELFDAQPDEYRIAVIPNDGTPCLAIEAGVPWGWYRYVGANGDVIGLDRFGESAPYEDVFKALGFTVENVTARALALLGRHQAASGEASRGDTLVGSGAGPTEGHS